MTTYTKNVINGFKSGFARFLSIMAIIALGVGFTIGISQSTPDMKTSMSDYLREQNAYDVDLKSSVGYTQSQIESTLSIKQKNEYIIESYLPIVSSYVLGTNNGVSTPYNIISFDFSVMESDYNGEYSYLNNLTLIEGNLPSESGEVLAVQQIGAFEDVQVGDVITLPKSITSSNSTYGDIYKESSYKVVGIVKSVDYFYTESREVTNIGNGVLGGVLIGNTDDVYSLYGTTDGLSLSLNSTYFDMLGYVQGEKVIATDLWVSIKGASKYELFSDNYSNYVLDKLDNITTTFFSGDSDKITTLSNYGVTITDTLYTLDRASCNISYVSYQMNVEKVESIAGLFPPFFIVVAALVALTSMTRMVEEDRLEIGTLKALGYGEKHIMGKYLSYTLLATIIGLVVGILLGFSILPTIIWQAYGILYTLPTLKLGFSWYIALSVVFVSIILTMLVTIYASLNTTKENPTKLMQPKAPKAGQRIMLERVTIIWKPIKFKWKATIRNIFRYKRNMLLTIISITGCTALILAAFGVNDSVEALSQKQYTDIIFYDTIVTYDSSQTDYDDLLDSISYYTYINVYSESGTLVMGSNRENVTCYLIDDMDDFSSFVSLHYRTSGKQITLSDGIILPENVADAYGVSQGDSITYITTNGLSLSLTVSAIAEYYTSSVIYMSTQTYLSVTNSEITYNTYLLNIGVQSYQSLMDAVSTSLLSIDAVTGVEFTYTTLSTFTSLTTTMSFVILVLIISAGGLAGIVLYNLTNINIDERRREIATLRVLGYTKWEAAGYIYRESVLLTIVGTLLGLGIGKLFHMYVVPKVGSVAMFLGREIHPLSYLYAVLITLGFAVVVWAFMLIKLYKIQMADSLKSNE